MDRFPPTVFWLDRSSVRKRHTVNFEIKDLKYYFGELTWRATTLIGHAPPSCDVSAAGEWDTGRAGSERRFLTVCLAF